MGGNFYIFFSLMLFLPYNAKYKSTFFKKHTARYQILCPLDDEGIRNLNLTEKKLPPIFQIHVHWMVKG